MIFEPLINLLTNLVVEAMQGFNLVTVPVNAIEALGTFCAYGNAIVGADLMLIFASTVLAWMTIKAGLGLILFIWRLLPFT